MKTLLILVSCLLICSLASCEYDTDRRQLAYIDTIMETSPDSALSLLSNISPGELSSDNLAYYSLLFTQAQFKNYIQVSSDSLIQFAYGKYCNSSSEDLRKRACFYNSRVALNDGRFPAAMGDAVVAYELAKEADDPYWMAKTAELISDIFNDTYNYEQAEIYEKQAIDYYLKAGKIANHRYALCDLASTYRNDSRNEEATAILDSLYEVVSHEQPLDSALIDYMMEVSVHIMYDNDMTDEIEETQKKFNPDTTMIGHTIINSYLTGSRQGSEKADAMLKDYLGTAEHIRDSVLILYAIYRNDLSAGNYKRAALLGDSLIMLQSMIASDMLKESVTGVQRDFYTYEAVRQEHKSKFLFLLLIGVIVVSSVIVSLGVWIHRLRIAAKDNEIESWISETKLNKEQNDLIARENKSLSEKLGERSAIVTNLSAELGEKSAAIESLQHELDEKSCREKDYTSLVEELFTEQWGTLNKLFDQYFEMGDSDLTRMAIFNDIKKEIKRLKAPKNLRQIESSVNTHLGGIMSLLREECAFLKEEEYVFLSLIYAGFSVRAICLITDIKYKMFYLRKSRILKRIAESDAPHKDLFKNKMR